jgi:hypothetical protein
VTRRPGHLHIHPLFGIMEMFREYSFCSCATTAIVRSPAGGEVPRFRRFPSAGIWTCPIAYASSLL